MLGAFIFSRVTSDIVISRVEVELPFLGHQEGAGHQVNSAFVELVFDNQDHRIPVSVCCFLFTYPDSMFVLKYRELFLY